MQPSFKLDEGYSEETRSQTGSDEAMEPEPTAGTTAGLVPAPYVGLPDWIMALGEDQRSGADPIRDSHST